MMIKEEKHTKNGSIAFLVDITNKENNQQHHNNLKIKQKLESEALAAHGPMLTLEQIKEKLHRAEEKRKLQLTHLTAPFEEKMKRVIERKASHD